MASFIMKMKSMVRINDRGASENDIKRLCAADVSMTHETWLMINDF